MAGIGVKLERLYSKRSIISTIAGFGYSIIFTIAPVGLVMGAVIVMQLLLDVASLGYGIRQLFACTVLYVFVFAMIVQSPINSVISRFLSDAIYDERWDDIMAAYNFGGFINVLLASALGIPFCVHEHLVGGVDIWYVFAGYATFASLTLAFYTQLFLQALKAYQRISLYYLIGMVFAVLLSLLLHMVTSLETTFVMLISLAVGFLLIVVIEYGLLNQFFKGNSKNYKRVAVYFKKYILLIFTNLFYTVGLYVHNFVFWATPQAIVVAKSFYCYEAYDMATCIAMFLNISATVIFTTRIELHFQGRYRDYSEATIGGRGIDIDNAKARMFTTLSDELFSLVRIQFIITVVVYLFTVVILPRFGMGGTVMRIYPSMAAGYFVLFVMYATIILMYYYNDNIGAFVTAGSFLAVTVGVTIFATQLSEIWYGIGVFAGSMVGFIFGYRRLQWMERNLDWHIFCQGDIMERGEEKMPSNLIYNKETARLEEVKEAGTNG